MIGERVFHYHIRKPLGSGGMGVVYRARDESLERDVALKFLPPNLTRDESARQRFIQEAKTASALNHPNVCTIHEIGMTEDGRLYIVMPIYEGQTLKQRLSEPGSVADQGSPSERTGLPLEEALSITSQIAKGLRAAHRKGIAHRDIKPANIVVTNEGRAVILDFGLAKLAGGLDLTKTGSTIGTTYYMSPEQASGGTVDHRTDVWSLGAVLYEMLTSRRPFEGDYEQAVVYSILNEEPVPATNSRPDLESEVADLIVRCLDKDPDRRPDIEELIALEAGSAPVRPVSEASHRTVLLPDLPGRRAVMVGVAVLMALVVLLYTLVGESFYVDEPLKERIPIAVVDFVNETGEPELNGLSGMLITALEQSPRLSVMTRSRLFDELEQLGQEDVERINEQLGRQICQRAGVNLMAIGSIRRFGDKYNVDLKVLDRGSDKYVVTASRRGRSHEAIPDLIDDLASETRRGLRERGSQIATSRRALGEMTTVNLEAYQHFFEGEQRLDRLEVDDAIAEFQAGIELDSMFGLAYYRLGYALHLVGRNDRAREAFDRAVALIDRIPEKQQYLARAHSTHLSHTDEALDEGLAILREMERRYPDDKEMLFAIGDWAYHAGYYEESRTYLERVRDIDPNFSRNLFHLALLYRETGEPEKMFATAERILQVSSSPFAHYLIGGALTRLGRYDEAIDAIKQGLEMEQDWSLYEELIFCYLQMGDRRSAEATALLALESDETNPWNRYAYAEVLLIGGQEEKAVAFARQIQSGAERTSTPETSSHGCCELPEERRRRQR